MADEIEATGFPSPLSEAIRDQLPLARKPLGDDVTGPIVISVIISSYNAREVLADCLASIYRNPPREPYEIIVVDDASGDGTSEMVRARFPEVRLLTNQVNLHYTRSNNLALGRARGEYIHLLNNDTIVMPNAFDAMVAFLRSHPDAGAVGSRLLNEDGTIQWSVKQLPSFGSAFFGGRGLITKLFPNNRYTQRHFYYPDRDVTAPFVAGYISGASKMMPRSIIDKVGQLDHRMFYHVDADYCKRIAQAGYKNFYLPDAAVIHLNHKGGTMVSARSRVRSLYSFHSDCYNYYCKHMERSSLSLFRPIILAALAVNFVTLLTIQLASEVVRSIPRPKRVAS